MQSVRNDHQAKSFDQSCAPGLKLPSDKTYQFGQHTSNMTTVTRPGNLQIKMSPGLVGSYQKERMFLENEQNFQNFLRKYNTFCLASKPNFKDKK